MDVNNKSKISDDVQAFFLLELASLSEDMEGQVLAATNNSYKDLEKVKDAMRFQASNVHKHERRN